MQKEKYEQPNSKPKTPPLITNFMKKEMLD